MIDTVAKGFVSLEGWFIAIFFRRLNRRRKIRIGTGLVVILLGSAYQVTHRDIIEMLLTAGMAIVFVIYIIARKKRVHERLNRAVLKFGARARGFSIPNRERLRFYTVAARHARIFATVNKLIKQHVKGTSGTTSVEKMYELEFSSAHHLLEIDPSLQSSASRVRGALNDNYGCHYFFVNALFIKNLRERIIGVEDEELRAKKILEVGSGNGQFVGYLIANGCLPENIIASDIVGVGLDNLQTQGVDVRVGRLEKIGVADSSCDVVFLSYFMDFDDAQRKTIEAGVRCLAPDGRLIIETIAPCPLSKKIGGHSASKDIVTKGYSAEGDIALICDALVASGIGMTIDNVFAGKRYIYNQNGARPLASYFIVARRI